jgi:hypothetical protein
MRRSPATHGTQDVVNAAEQTTLLLERLCDLVEADAPLVVSLQEENVGHIQDGGAADVTREDVGHVLTPTDGDVEAALPDRALQTVREVIPQMGQCRAAT